MQGGVVGCMLLDRIHQFLFFFLSLPNKAGHVSLWWPSHHSLNQMVD